MSQNNTDVWRDRYLIAVKQHADIIYDMDQTVKAFKCKAEALEVQGERREKWYATRTAELRDRIHQLEDDLADKIKALSEAEKALSESRCNEMPGGFDVNEHAKVIAVFVSGALSGVYEDKKISAIKMLREVCAGLPNSRGGRGLGLREAREIVEAYGLHRETS